MKKRGYRVLLALVMLLLGASSAFAVEPPAYTHVAIHRYWLADSSSLSPGNGSLLPELPEGATPAANISFTLTKMIYDGMGDVAAVESYKPASGEDALSLLLTTDETGLATTQGDDSLNQGAGLPRGYYLVEEQPHFMASSTTEPFILVLPFRDPAVADAWLETVHLYPKSGSNGLAKYIGQYGQLHGTIANDGMGTAQWLIQLPLPAAYGEQADASITIYDALPGNLQFVTGSLQLAVLKTADGEAVPLTNSADYLAFSQQGSSLEMTIVNAQGNLDFLYPQGDASYRYLRLSYQTQLLPVTAENQDRLVADSHRPLATATEDFCLEYGGERYYCEQMPELHYGQIEIIAQRQGDPDTPLAGAVFKLAESAEAAQRGEFVPAGDGAGDLTATTGETGVAYMQYVGYNDGLAYDDAAASSDQYWLLAVDAPAGYHLPNEPVAVSLNNAFGPSLPDDFRYLASIRIGFDDSWTLPATGGSGALLLPLLGVLLLAFGGWLWWRSGRRGSTSARG